ncbi:hypothetical protein MNB_SUP05-SYMBIONT-7-673 [hydrothermal vent metagenome]|uniref:Uncharacterized protein n=1 Tax=hydrothermal vent metagenome TaxID=652676 RepID=A0A1W1E385_9ZZZZ
MTQKARIIVRFKGLKTDKGYKPLPAGGVYWGLIQKKPEYLPGFFLNN